MDGEKTVGPPMYTESTKNLVFLQSSGGPSVVLIRWQKPERN